MGFSIRRLLLRLGDDGERDRRDRWDAAWVGEQSRARDLPLQRFSVDISNPVLGVHRGRELLGVDAASEAPPTTSSATDRILQLTGVDILHCPMCGEGPMRRIERLAPDTS
jgi:hypothetical protein